MKGIILTPAALPGVIPPDEFAEAIFEIERELDELHPVWKQPAKSRLGPSGRGIVGSRGITETKVLVRVKWLLQRRKLLYQGKDWKVTIRRTTGRDGQPSLVALVSKPRSSYSNADIQAMAETPIRQPSLPEIAHKMGISVKRAEALADGCPAGRSLYRHIRHRLNEERVAQLEEELARKS